MCEDEGVRSPQRPTGRTDFPHNALSPQCIVGTYGCVNKPESDSVDTPRGMDHHISGCGYSGRCLYMYVCLCQRIAGTCGEIQAQ